MKSRSSRDKRGANTAKERNWAEYNEALVNRGGLLARELFKNSQIVVVKTEDGEEFDVLRRDALLKRSVRQKTRARTPPPNERLYDERPIDVPVPSDETREQVQTVIRRRIKLAPTV